MNLLKTPRFWNQDGLLQRCYCCLSETSYRGSDREVLVSERAKSLYSHSLRGIFSRVFWRRSKFREFRISITCWILLHIATCTRPDISCATSVLLKSSQERSHSNPELKARWHPSGKIELLRVAESSELFTFTDSDYAADTGTQKSQIGACVFFQNSIVYWTAKPCVEEHHYRGSLRSHRRNHRDWLLSWSHWFLQQPRIYANVVDEFPPRWKLETQCSFTVN